MEAFVGKPTPARHRTRKNCACENCRNDRSLGCTNPHKCRNAAKKTLDALHPKWDPRILEIDDGLDLTPEKEAENASARKEDGPIIFDPSVRTTGSLKEGFRVFVCREALSNYPAYRPRPPVPIEDAVKVYTDGSCTNNGDEDAKAGSGVWYAPNDERNTAVRLPGPNQTNNAGETAAVLIAAQKTQIMAPLHIMSDSTYVIDGLTENLHAWEDRGWIGVSNKDLMQATAARLRLRGNITIFQKVKGHSGDVGNDGADREAAKGAEKETADDIDLTVPKNFVISGAKLSKMTQALLYKGIMERKTRTIRRGTTICLDMTRYAVQEISKSLPTDSKIWHAIRSPDISRNIRAFLWRCMHRAQRCGEWWHNIPNYEHRADCHVCETTESMEHILTECNVSGQETIWNLVEFILQLKKIPWKRPTIGSLLGCGLVDIRDEEGKRKTGATRLYRIVVSESMHLVWKLRCEWRISRGADPERVHTVNEIQTRWLKALDTRLRLDGLMTDKRRYGSKALSLNRVRKTWEGVLQDDHRLPDTWPRYTEGLVGIGVARPPGRNR
ncbi:ribonuclease H-like protein [Rickenella mellea]|uniref:ribonuclease H n=1 Tax=Rickenella mellea TaxID=50990 RepID=A0A4Y7PS97_9AGAM|nr:ribonuclease H-like protein [Rickenella mellea]